MAMARSCSWSGLPRPMDASSSVTATSRDFSSVPPDMPAAWSEVQAHGDGARMSLEPLGAAERDGGGPERAQRVGAAFEDRGALHKIEDAQARREAGRAGRRQD